MTSKAKILFDGTLEWRIDLEYDGGYLHNDKGPAVLHTDGSFSYWQYGKPHRVDGPAWVFSDGVRWWKQNGKFHRLNGPAVESPDGNNQYYINDQLLTEEEFFAPKTTI